MALHASERGREKSYRETLWHWEREAGVMYYGFAVASQRAHNIGMARFQNGGSNHCISVFTAISSPGSKCQRLKVHRAA